MTPESRTRMVSFRLTLEEYDRFRELCYARGLRNVSEMVRLAVNHLLANSNAEFTATPIGRSLESRLTEVEGRLQDLTLTVERMNQPAPFQQRAASR